MKQTEKASTTTRDTSAASSEAFINNENVFSEGSNLFTPSHVSLNYSEGTDGTGRRNGFSNFFCMNRGSLPKTPIPPDSSLEKKIWTTAFQRL